jgi:hypothetical protein
LDEIWSIGIIDCPIDRLAWPIDPLAIRWLRAPAGSYYADPFGLPDGSIVCERLDHRDGQGRLVQLLPRAGGGWEENALPLGLIGHASFPFLLEQDGTLYCLPENAVSRRLALWRRDRTGAWRHHRDVLLNVAAVDATLFRWDGRWWIAYTDGDLGPHDNLCLLHAESLEGPWAPHVANPVKIDVGSSRPAGTPYILDGRLHRPAQDCSVCYGGAVVINRVLELTPERFQEVLVARLPPQRNWACPHGVHTLAAWGSRTLIDAKRHGFVASAFARRLRRRLPFMEAWRPASAPPHREALP